jgi:hypothetical protein
MIRPKASSLASLRGQVSTTRPPCSTSARTTASTGSGPRSAIAVTGRVEPKPTIGSVSPVVGMRRAGIARDCAAAPVAPATPAAAANARKSRRVVVACMAQG